MDKSRRSMFGLLAAGAAVVAASKVKVAEAAPVPNPAFAIGEVRSFFSHHEARQIGVHTHSFCENSSDHSHGFMGGGTTRGYAPSYVGAPVTKLMRWDGSAWVDLT